MVDGSLYAVPRRVVNIRDCYFYHTMDIPGYGRVNGQWDLREGWKDYLGHVQFKDKRVLEIGTASGFLCFAMENEGAEVVAFDLSDEHPWDIVPYAGEDSDRIVNEYREHIRKLNNGFWLSHQAFNSRAKVVYGSVYSIPEEIGPVDICTLGSILLHVRDPFLALQNALHLTKETAVVTELVPRILQIPIVRRFGGAAMRFVPGFDTRVWDRWWQLTPEIIARFLGVLGFEETRVRYHTQVGGGTRKHLFTLVGHRTRSSPISLARTGDDPCDSQLR